MSLKQIIHRAQLFNAEGIDAELTLPGEPMIYCIKFPIGKRRLPMQYFRNKQFRSLLKCYFLSYYKTKVPVVALVRFYVTPPDSVKIKASDLRKENVPATFSYELCDYLLSFLEMLHHVLINSYRQFVKIDVEKFYSNKPRTVMKFMKWDHYVNIYPHHTTDAKSKSKRTNRKVRTVQPSCPGNGANEQCSAEITAEGLQAADRTSSCDSPLSDSCGTQSGSMQEESATPAPTRQKTGRRQSREIS
jgi:hypothetical protein